MVRGREAEWCRPRLCIGVARVREAPCIGEMLAGSREVVSRWLFGGALFVFVLPFVTVSWMGEPVATISGATLVAGRNPSPAGELAGVCPRGRCESRRRALAPPSR